LRLGRRFGFYPRNQGRVPHISLVFREMWDTAVLPSSLLRAKRSHACPQGLQNKAVGGAGRERWNPGDCAGEKAQKHVRFTIHFPPEVSLLSGLSFLDFCSGAMTTLRISYFAPLATPTYAPLRRESRMQFLNATALDRKSGGA
jgi:hypothetical protein